MYAAEEIRQPIGHPHPVRKNPVLPRKKTNSRKTEQSVSRQDVLARKAGVLFCCVMVFMALNLFLLTRFAEITAAKHQVAQLESEVEQLQNQREQLQVKIERASSLEWIEQEAVSRLGMQYPDREQTIYINVDPAQVELLAGRIGTPPAEEQQEEGLLPNSIESMFHKFASVLPL